MKITSLFVCSNTVLLLSSNSETEVALVHQVQILLNLLMVLQNKFRALEIIKLCKLARDFLQVLKFATKS